MAHTIEEMEEYYQLLESLYYDSTYRTTANEDRAHNTTMLRFMLDTSTSAEVNSIADTLDVNMYCGEMSIFRKGFYEEIDREAPELSTGTKLKNLLIESLRTFINRSNARLNIIMEKFSPNFFNDLIDRNLFKIGAGQRSINIRKVNPAKIQTVLMSHFTVSDRRILRMETDMVKHQGLCGFHIDEDFYNDLNQTFAILHNASEEIEPYMI